VRVNKERQKNLTNDLKS